MTFNVFGLKIKLIFDRGLGNRTGWQGYYCDQKKHIAIDDSLKDFQLNQTIWHEFFHAVFYRVGLPQTKISNEVQEMIVENFATATVENAKMLKRYL